MGCEDICPLLLASRKSAGISRPLWKELRNTRSNRLKREHCFSAITLRFSIVKLLFLGARLVARGITLG